MAKESLNGMVTRAIGGDERFSDPKQSWNTPHVCDVLASDDDGNHTAVIRKPDGSMVKHNFQVKGGEAKLADGDPEPTHEKKMYASQIAVHDAILKAARADKSPVLFCSASGIKLPGNTWEMDKPARFQWMPGGIKTIVASWGERPIQVTVQCDEDTATTVQASFARKLTENPNQKPFGDVEHREHEAALWPESFDWSDEPSPGVFCTAKPSALGAQNVNGRLHRSWSPSFSTNAEYPKAICSSCGQTAAKCKGADNGVVTFPAGVRGSSSNPASITGIGDSIGSLTNKPAFKDILPVRARDASAATTTDELLRAGDFPGHAFHGNQYADGTGGGGEHNDASRAAHEKSKSAETSQNHRGAAAAHRKAARMHDEEGNDKVADYHRAMSTFHEQQAGKMTKASDAMDADTIFAALAKQAAPPPEQNNADNSKAKMKINIIKARDKFKAGDEVELTAAEAGVLLASGDAETMESKMNRETIKATNKMLVTGAFTRARARGAIAPKDDAPLIAATARLEETGFQPMVATLLAEQFDSMPSREDAAIYARHTNRVTDEGKDFGGNVTIVRESIRDVGMGYIKAREPMKLLTKNGCSAENIQAAVRASAESCALLKAHIMPILARGGDISLGEIIRAADTADPNAQVGTLATGLVLMRNLGFLKKKLSFLPYISTDLRNEPCMYGQTILTRYITPPGVLTFVPGVGFTSDAVTIAAAGLNVGGANYASGMAPTQASGTKTVSVPSTTDVNVKINRCRAVEITFPTTTLGSTVRNLFAEQQGAQFYSLAEYVNSEFLVTMFQSAWTPITAPSYSIGQNFGLTGLINIKTRFSANKLPDMGRFILLHSFPHDNILADGNLVTAKAITALVNKDLSSFESGELPPLYNIHVLESQLSAATIVGGVATLVQPTDPLTIGQLVGATGAVGFAGNSASGLFVARVPQDYTKVFSDIPATASIEIITEPDSGLSIMFTKYVDHGLSQVTARCSLMYGFAQGDPRQGFILNP